MKKVIDWVFTSLFIVVFFFVLIVLHPIQVIFTLFGYNGISAASHLFMWGVVQSVRFTGAIFDIKGLEALLKASHNRPLIVVSNHQSEFEIAFIGWYIYKTTGHHCKFIAKEELKYWIPSISWILRHSRHAIINRKERVQALKVIDSFAEVAQANNYATCIFVEGTRSKDGVLKPFKTAGFKQLFDKMPSALVVTATVQNFYRTKQVPIEAFLPLKLTFSPPMERTASQTAEDVLKECENIIQTQLGTPATLSNQTTTAV